MVITTHPNISAGNCIEPPQEGNATFFQKDDLKQKAMTLVYNKMDLIRHDFFVLGLF